MQSDHTTNGRLVVNLAIEFMQRPENERRSGIFGALDIFVAERTQVRKAHYLALWHNLQHALKRMLSLHNAFGVFLNYSLSLNGSHCLLCHTLDPQPVDAETMDDASPDSPEQTTQRHILRHLEAIALPAIPDIGDADEVELDAQQPSSDSGAQRIKATDDLPLAVFEDEVAGRAEDEIVPDQDGHDDCWAAVFRSQAVTPRGASRRSFNELRDERKVTTNAQVVVEGKAATEETGLAEGVPSRIESQHMNRALAERGLGIKILFGP